MKSLKKYMNNHQTLVIVLEKNNDKKATYVIVV